MTSTLFIGCGDQSQAKTVHELVIMADPRAELIHTTSGIGTHPGKYDASRPARRGRDNGAAQVVRQTLSIARSLRAISFAVVSSGARTVTRSTPTMPRRSTST